MSILMISFKNVKKNGSFYSLYLFSIAFILTIYFAFVSFSMNEIILEKISEDGRVETMISTISVFFMAFVIFYMSYSNNFFMRRRMKELGIYALLGYRKSTMLRIFALENVIICTGAFVIGILLGSVVHKGIIAGIVNLLGLNIDQTAIPFLNFQAIEHTAFFVIIVILGLYISNWKLLHKTTVLNLVRLEKKHEKSLKTRVVPAVFGLLITILGDYFLIDAIRQKNSLWVTIGLVPMGLATVICITLGTILSIYSFLPYVLQRLENKKDRLYKSIEIVSIPKAIYRIRTNAKTLIMLSLLSAGTLCIFGTGVLTAYYPIVSIERIVPSALEFRIENKDQSDEVIRVLKEKIGADNFKEKTTELIKVTSISKNLPEEYSLTENKGSFEVIKVSDYLELLEQQGKQSEIIGLDNDECVLVKYRFDAEQSDIGNAYQLNLGKNNTVEVTVVNTTLQNPIGFANSIGTLIVSDQVYNKMQRSELPIISVMSINGNKLRNNKEVYEAIQNILGDNIYFASAYARTYEIIYENSSTFLLLGFLTVLFFIASGSILHFHNISAVSYDKDEYLILSKMGYSNKKLKAIIRNQIRSIYLIPLTLGLIHAVCGMFCYKALLMDDVLGNSNLMLMPVILSLVVSVLIYFSYYLATKRACYKIIV